MILTKPMIQIESEIERLDAYRLIERAGRTCYKSEGKVDDTSYETFIPSIIKRGHESVLEHYSVSVRVICDRGVSHEIVRHRIASYSQESTRYCNYKGGVEFIIPSWIELDEGQYGIDKIVDGMENGKWNNEIYGWLMAMLNSENSYLSLIKEPGKWLPQQARSVLPNSLKTEIVMTMNLREWRLFFKLRTAKVAHPDMQIVAKMILSEFKKELPLFFNDVKED